MEEAYHNIESKHIKSEAMRLGFAACGVARADAVDEETATRFRQWLAEGNHAEMHYMENHLEKRLDPRLLLEGAKTIVCVALNYTPAKRLPEGEYQLADYALGQDYHDLMRQKLHQLATAILSSLDGGGLEGGGPPYRAFVDSAPILERYWAVRAGLGWIGRNHQLIIPSPTMGGTRFFLGELLLCQEMDEYDKPMRNHCGNCQRCIEACPTGAISKVDPTSSAANRNEMPPYSMFSAEKCLSYQTIENRGSLSQQAIACMGDTIYGCDRCQQVCPWNRFAQPTNEPLLQPREELLAMTREEWQQLAPETYRRLFKGSAVKRAKYEGLMRNIQAASER